MLEDLGEGTGRHTLGRGNRVCLRGTRRTGRWGRVRWARSTTGTASRRGPTFELRRWGRTLLDTPLARQERHVAGRWELAERHRHGRRRVREGRGIDGGRPRGVGEGGRSSPGKGDGRIVPSAVVAFGRGRKWGRRDYRAACRRWVAADGL